MAIRLTGSLAKQMLRRSSKSLAVPKGFLAVYVGQTKKKRFVVPVSYLNQPIFQNLLSKAEDEFGFDHPMGGLTIPCREDTFINVTSSLSRSRENSVKPVTEERISFFLVGNTIECK